LKFDIWLEICGQVLSLIIDDIGHVNHLVVIVRLQTAQVNIIVEKLVLLIKYALLDGLNLLILLAKQLCKVSLAIGLILVHDVPELSEVLLHLILYDLPVALLDPLKILLSLLQLRFSVEN
jgi:hypothetical protein